MPRALLLCAALLALCIRSSAQGSTNQQNANLPADKMHWRSGLTEINEGWAAHAGDNPAWASPAFDDSAWQTVDLEDMGAAQPGWHWFRKHVTVGPENPTVKLLIEGGVGTYELYVNGERVSGADILSALEVNRPVERVFTLSDENGDFEIALRTHATSSYVSYGFPLFLSATLGRQPAIEYEQQALQSRRMYAVAPVVAINLLLILAALGALALFASQRTERDYLYLALFLFLTGLSNALWHLQQAGVVSMALNFFVADPLVYLVSIAQIEFTFSFARRRLGHGWRLYEVLLLLPPLLVPAVWFGHFSQDTYNLIEAGVTAPLALLLPAFLAYWYRRGNREAGLLIFPSLVPTAMGVLFNLGIVSTDLGWKRFDNLSDPITLGAFPVQISDVGSIVFLFAIGIVMFLRFTRVSRDQARSAAELAAAREIQQRLVPATLPEVHGYRIETAYLPAQEVGGDFYQVLPQSDGATLIVVGDVSGKGLKAAMTGTLAIGALRALGGEGLQPGLLLARLNREMVRAQDGGFITCLCALVAVDGAVVLANAGHLAPYRSGEEIPVDSGLPLGITDAAAYAETAIQLREGDMLTLISDGVLEARNAAGELFGFERTAALSMQTADQIAKAAEEFGQEDDITVLTVMRVATS
jgi:stage II sporulation SpoE-like protein